MKVLDAESLHHGLQETILALDHLNTQIKGIQKAVDGFLHLENDFKGQGAEAIRSFYRECHVPLLLFMEGFLWDYQDILKQIQKSLQSFDPHQRAFIRQDFLEQELQQGIRKAKNVTMDITNAVNASLRSVNDLVSLPSIDDGAFLHRMDQSKEKIQATLEQLHQFDRQSTSRLEKAEKDLSLMQNYIRE
ncbi:LXG domain-containing protein, partial [Oceanobacillus saliphilus]|uniref:LXG domain-containing protein n=1 Tax=Oceanobacillus saliphilus TaxID=2925834 RepID=UPI00201DB5C7